MSLNAPRRSIKNVLTDAPKRFAKLLKSSVGLSDLSDGPEETHWAVGGRYLVLHSLDLRARPDKLSDTIGQLKARDTVLLLALQSIPEDADPSQPQVLLAYLANTKKPDWVAGWGVIGGNSLPVPVLRRRRLRGSWEVGGRYVVNGSPILRSGIELESEQLFEIKAKEEVLILDLGLVIRSGEPRLRARVRTDAGALGWLTIELPGGEPLLDIYNVYTEEALFRRGTLFGTFSGSSKRCCRGNRVTLDGNPEGGSQAYVKGGKYRLLTNAVVHEECDTGSPILGQLRRGMLVNVNEVKIIPRESGAMITRLFVWWVSATDSNGENVSAVGWVSATDSNGEKIVDSRDHLEYEKLMRSLIQAPSSELSADPQHLERRDCCADKAPIPPEPASPPGPPHVTNEVLEERTVASSSDMDVERHLPGAMQQADEEQHAEVGMQLDRPNSRSREARRSHPPAGQVQTTFAPLGPQQAIHATPPAQAYHKSEPVPTFQPPQRSLQDPYILKRPWGANSGYRPLSELEEGADDKDERAVDDNLDQENANYGCGCRAGFLSCGGLSYRKDKVKTHGNRPNSFMGGMNMLGEPAPEPRPMRQLPSPPAFHATAIPD